MNFERMAATGLRLLKKNGTRIDVRRPALAQPADPVRRTLAPALPPEATWAFGTIIPDDGETFQSDAAAESSTMILLLTPKGLTFPPDLGYVVEMPAATDPAVAGEWRIRQKKTYAPTGFAVLHVAQLER